MPNFIYFPLFYFYKTLQNVALRLSQDPMINFGPKRLFKICVVSMISMQCLYWHCAMLPMMCLRAGLRFFKICHSAELNKIVEAKMPVNQYVHRTVSLWRSHIMGDLDITQTA